MNDYFNSILKTITDSIRGMDEARYNLLVENAADVLRHGSKIVVTGLGKNVPICEKFVGTMLSFGLNATFLHTNTAVHGDLGAVHDGDMVIILSKSGETIESIFLLEQLKKRKVDIWAITFDENSSLAKGADHSLIITMDHEGDKWNIVPNNSTTLYLIVLQAVAIELSDIFSVTIEDFKKNHPGGAIGEKLKNL